MMRNKLFVAPIAAALMILPIGTALGSDNAGALQSRSETGPRALMWETPLPLVPRFDTVPWLDAIWTKAPRVELLIGPKLDALAPLRLQPADPAPQMSANLRLGPQSAAE